MDINELQLALSRISVPYLKLETIETEENENTNMNVSGQSEISMEGDEKDASKVKNTLEIFISIFLKIQADDLSIEMQICGNVMIKNNQLPFSELEKENELKKRLFTPFLAKASQVLANLTADNAPFPLIMDFDYEHMFVGNHKKGSRKKK